MMLELKESYEKKEQEKLALEGSGGRTKKLERGCQTCKED